MPLVTLAKLLLAVTVATSFTGTAQADEGAPVERFLQVRHFHYDGKIVGISASGSTSQIVGRLVFDFYTHEGDTRYAWLAWNFKFQTKNYGIAYGLPAGLKFNDIARVTIIRSPEYSPTYRIALKNGVYLDLNPSLGLLKLRLDSPEASPVTFAPFKVTIRDSNLLEHINEENGRWAALALPETVAPPQSGPRDFKVIVIERDKRGSPMSANKSTDVKTTFPPTNSFHYADNVLTHARFSKSSWPRHRLENNKKAGQSQAHFNRADFIDVLRATYPGLRVRRPFVRDQKGNLCKHLLVID